MTGSSMPQTAEPGSPVSQPSQPRHRSGLQGLEAILQQRWNEVASNPDPRMHAVTPSPAELPQSLAARLQVLAPVEAGLDIFLDRLESELRSQRTPSTALVEGQRPDPETPLSAAPLGTPQAYVQALVGDFTRRQRQANLLVAGCVAASCVLTLVGLAAMASLAGPNAGASENPSRRSSSLAWQGPAPGAPVLVLASANPDRAAKSDSLFLDARDGEITPAPALAAAILTSHASTPELIVTQSDRPLALGPLIEQRQARYYLIRGLPSEATLSSGDRYPSGAWFVKAAEIGNLTLTIAGDAAGDYTAEIYALGTSAIPQGRQRLVFRAETALPRTAAVEAEWDPTLRDMVITSGAALNVETSAADATKGASAAGKPGPAWRTKILASLSD